MTKFVVAAHGVIHRDGKILTTHRAADDDYMANLWDFPGGKVDAGETPEEGLVREISEETGLTVEIGEIEHVYTNLAELPEVQYVLLVYRCSFVSGEVTLEPKEHQDFEWVEVDQLRERDVIHFVESWLNR